MMEIAVATGNHDRTEAQAVRTGVQYRSDYKLTVSLEIEGGQVHVH